MDILNFFIEPYKNYSFTHIMLEIIAACAGIVSVFLIGRRNISGYPTGIVSTSLYVWLLWQWNLMGDMMINVYYTAMSIYGWVNWAGFRASDNTVAVKRLDKKDHLPGILVFLLSFIFTMVVYRYRPYLDGMFSDEESLLVSVRIYQWSDYVDAITTSVFLIGMWLMARRKIENWIFWIAGNIISVPLYLWKGYGITSLQYLIFLFLAFAGWKKWKQFLQE